MSDTREMGHIMREKGRINVKSRSLYLQALIRFVSSAPKKRASTMFVSSLTGENTEQNKGLLTNHYDRNLRV